jgi:hypothetical protein
MITGKLVKENKAFKRKVINDEIK